MEITSNFTFKIFPGFTLLISRGQNRKKTNAELKTRTVKVFEQQTDAAICNRICMVPCEWVAQVNFCPFKNLVAKDSQDNSTEPARTFIFSVTARELPLFL